MIKKQIELVREKIQTQVHVVFKIERRKNRSKRSFLDSVCEDLKEISENREMTMTIATYMLRRLNDIKNTCGTEELFHMLQDEN